MKIPSSTFDFLKALKENNNREWFNDNREQYETARLNFVEFAQEILNGLSKIDKRIPTDLPVSKCVYRIYRDIRFSNDKTPYKGYFSAAYSPTGRSSVLPGYYLHIEPGQSFGTAGIWHPEKEKLTAIRQEIDYNGEKFRTIVDRLKSELGISLDQGDRLKKAPSGYAIDHPEIEFLRLKSFTASKDLSDDTLKGEKAVAEIIESFATLQSFQEFLYEAIEDAF